MSPLSLINDWYLSADEAIRLELVHLAAAYHPTAGAEHFGDDVELNRLFEYYMTQELSDRKEIVQRVFFLKSLLEACMAGRDTEAGWELSRVRNETIFKKMKSENPETDSMFYDRFMAGYEGRKTKWIAWCNQWNELITGKLRYDNVYYFGIQID